MKQILFFLLVATFSAGAWAASIKFESLVEQTALLELYSSEGCNSCPPAEQWLSSLKRESGLWRDFVPVAFHVDYWDYLGWRDPWARREFSDRQRNYAARWRTENVYTPGFVLNGKEWTGWSAGRRELKHSPAKAGILAVSSDDTNHWLVDFSPLAKLGDEQYEVHAALLAGGMSSDVKAGENRGRRLMHDFVVLNLIEKSLSSSGGSIMGEFALPQPRDASGSSLALAVWMTKTGSLEPVQATGGWIVKPASFR